MRHNCWAAVLLLGFAAVLHQTAAVPNPPDVKNVTGYGLVYCGLYPTVDIFTNQVSVYVNIYSSQFSSNHSIIGNLTNGNDVHPFAQYQTYFWFYQSITGLQPNTKYTLVADYLDPDNNTITTFTKTVTTVSLCGFTDNSLTSTPKEVTTPGWPTSYPVNTFCIWNLTADPCYKVNVTLHEGESEIYDYLYAISTNTFLFSPIFAYGNVTQPRHGSSNGRNFIILFSSDPSVTKKGFRWSYYQTVDENCTTPVPMMTTPEMTTMPYIPTTAFTPPPVSVTGSGGNGLVHLDLGSPHYNFSITFSGTVTNVSNVGSHILQGLQANTAYDIVVEVMFDGTLVATVTLNVKTASSCTKTCLNSVCALNNGVDEACKCRPGYAASFNDSNTCVDVNECRFPGLQCQANSVCSNTVGSYVCRCNSGYKLVNGVCEVISLCEINDPCQNGGTCSPLPNDFQCNCPKYFKGKACQSYESPCISQPCANLGKCNDLFGSYNCTCTSRFTGQNCTEDADECKQNTHECVANAMCLNRFGGYSCPCQEGYRGDGFVKCYEIVLLPYGPAANDELVTPIRDGASSPRIRFPLAVPFGRKSFKDAYVLSNGLVTLGFESWWARYVYQPYTDGFGAYRIPLLAPFWDDFHPHPNNNGRVYHQAYSKIQTTLTAAAQSIVDEVDKRIAKFSGNSAFKSLYVLKATWHEVVMWYERYNRDYPSTFQAILATDGEDTYVIYYYMVDGMLYNEGKRWWGSNNALIGYTNAEELEFIEVQGEYRPDKRPQTNGTIPGQYFYHLTPGYSKTVVSNARASCLKWYIEDSSTPWEPSTEPCPCTAIQARFDRRFTVGVERFLHWIQIITEFYSQYWWFSAYGYVDGSNITTTEWNYEEATYGRCYQMRRGNGPRCCYGSRENAFNRWWGWWIGGPLISGPLSSRYERYQIPITEGISPWWWWWRNFIFYRDQTRFNQQLQQAIDLDLTPRRHCCVESESKSYCDLYKRQRPAANCDGYVQRRPSWTFGDPHITTIDGNTYTFNGLGEFIYLHAPNVFAIQARIKPAKKDDGTDAGGTIFVSFAAKDLTVNGSGTVQFDVDPDNGTAVLVRVNGVLTNITTTETPYSQVDLQLQGGAVQATFPSSSSMSVSASDFMLSVQFTGDTATLMNVSKGLLGSWNGNKTDDFEFRNGTILDLESLKPTENLDILNGTLSEQKLYPFGLSWQITEAESIFNYTGGDDTFALHNPTPTSEPPFLEVLVADQKDDAHFASVLTNCTSNGVVSTTCLYDVLVTNRSEIGQTTLEDAGTSASVAASNSNTPPNITVDASSSSIENGDTFLAKVGELASFTVSATDPDGDSVSFSIYSNNSVPGITVDSSTGVVSWTPTEENRITAKTNQTLTIQAIDSAGGEAVLNLNIKLCVCNNSGGCLYDETLVGAENFAIVGCNCSEAYSGDDCSEDRNGCLLSACYANVTCTDNKAPNTGETCGPCPAGTTGDGRNCTNINFCDSNPCEHVCDPLYNDFVCTCNDGYQLTANNRTCEDIDECAVGTPCLVMPNSMCNNTVGNYTCYCPSGFTDGPNRCDDINECLGTFSCPSTATECFNKLGSYGCTCNAGYTRIAKNDDQSACTDIDECALNQHTCDNAVQVCRNTVPGFQCDCKSGYQLVNSVCDDIRECSDAQLNNCTQPNMRCIEEEGSFSCACLPGYLLTGGTCQDIDECLTAGICPVNSNCINRDGGYTCRCDPNYVCQVNPFVNPPTVLSRTKSCVTLIIDEAALYQSYEVRAVSNQNNILVNSSTIKTQICGLSPNTQYNITVRVLALKGSSQIFTTTEHSEVAVATTDPVLVRISLRITSETFVSEMSNITSSVSIALRGRHEGELKDTLTFTSSDPAVTSSLVLFIRLSAGSVRADSECHLNTQDGSTTATAVGTGLAARYADLETITNPPNAPANLLISSVTESTIVVRYDAVASAIEYHVQVSYGTTTMDHVATGTSHTITGLPSNTICSVKVAVIASVGTSGASARSDFSALMVTTTRPIVTNLVASSINETTAVISFDAVTRGVYYTIQSESSSSNLTQSNVVSGSLRLSVAGLVKSTTYTYTVVAVATDVDGNEHSSAPATLTFTTAGLCGVNPCLNGGLCFELNGIRGCTCLPGYTGILCETRDNSDALKIGLGVTGGLIGGALIVLGLVYYVKKRPETYQTQPEEKPSSFDE